MIPYISPQFVSSVRHHRIWGKTVLIVELGAYEEWFRYHNASVAFVLDYIVSALDVPHLAPEAASALKAICDLCRGNLTQHVASFGALHGKVAGMEVSALLPTCICSNRSAGRTADKSHRSHM